MSLPPISPSLPRPPQNVPANHTYYPALDGLRALGFLMVFGDHYFRLPWGFTGVDAFFVLSGFLITGILYDTRDSPHRVRNFYIRRVLRIFPLYYAVLALIVLAYPVFHWRWSWIWLVWPTYVGNFLCWVYPVPLYSALDLAATGQLLSRTHHDAILYIGHFWSLCIEEQFYLFWPWVVFWIKDRRKLIAICIAAVVLCPVLRCVIEPGLPQALKDSAVLYRTTPLRIDALLLGGLIALLRRGGHGRSLLRGARIAAPVLIASFALWHILNRAVWHSFTRYSYSDSLFTWGLSAVDLFFAALLILALQPGSLVYRIFNLRPLRWLGRISYGAYIFHDLLHVPLANFMAHFFANRRLTVAVAAMLLTLPVSWASYRWLESPFLRLKHRWAPQP